MASCSPDAVADDHHSPIRIGLIGCGNIWRTVYHPIVAGLGNRVTVTALCDFSSRAAEEAAALLPGARHCADAESLLREERIDAVMVLTSEGANAPTALAALHAGHAVYLEKPPAVSVSEWQLLAAAAESGGSTGRGRLYTAFNRRHTPLFRSWRLPEGMALRSVRGVLRRQGRSFTGFPFTAVHLIDSAQFFSGRLLTGAHSFFGGGETSPFWRIQGSFEDGAACDLTFVPDGTDHVERLVFETENRIWKLHFPNRDGTEYPGGLLVSRRVSPGPERNTDYEEVSGDPGADPLETMGYASCFRDFLDRITDRKWETCPNNLRRCETTITLLETMLNEANDLCGGDRRLP